MVKDEHDAEDYAIELPGDENLLDQQGDPPNDGSEIDDIGNDDLAVWGCYTLFVNGCLDDNRLNKWNNLGNIINIDKMVQQ